MQIQHDTAIQHAFCHVSNYADELARSMNALAVTIGHDIYFRSNAYKPETEDRQRLLEHELTHIQQYEENRINHQTDCKELEIEADQNEQFA